MLFLPSQLHMISRTPCEQFRLCSLPYTGQHFKFDFHQTSDLKAIVFVMYDFVLREVK